MPPTIGFHFTLDGLQQHGKDEIERLTRSITKKEELISEHDSLRGRTAASLNPYELGVKSNMRLAGGVTRAKAHVAEMQGERKVWEFLLHAHITDDSGDVILPAVPSHETRQIREGAQRAIWGSPR